MGRTPDPSCRHTSIAAALIVGVMSVAGAAQTGTAPRTLSFVERVELQESKKLVDAVAAGQLPGGDAWLKWRNHFLRAADGRTYVPFAISIEDAPEGFDSVAIYVRVSPRGQQTSARPQTSGDFTVAAAALSVPERQFARGNPTAGEAAVGLAALEGSLVGTALHTFEDVHFVRFRQVPASQPRAVQRALAVPRGTYDVYVSARERPSDLKRAGSPRWAVIKRVLDVPDFSRPDLTVSSIIVADHLEPLRAPLKPKDQIERPYALGSIEVVPRPDNHFTHDEQLTVVFFVHNPAADASGRTNLSIDYTFFQLSTPEKFFRQTAPQLVTDSIDARARQVPIDAILSLAPFPPGPYRLEIAVHDRITSATVTSQVVFTVE